MKRILALPLSAFICGVSPAAPPQPDNHPDDVRAIRQLEQDMGDAMVTGDIEKLKAIWADDWFIASASGRIYDKTAVVGNYKVGIVTLRSFVLGPMDVQVFGDIAICQGSATESKSREGKDMSGVYVWTDILKKRTDRWQVVQSLSDKVN
jgi:ketosteroid isomerase-like protein